MTQATLEGRVRRGDDQAADARLTVLPPVLTLRQPWAGLVATGAKRDEFRSWGTAHRGALLIHAGAAVDARAIDDVPDVSADAAARAAVAIGAPWQRSAIVAVAWLASVDTILAMDPWRRAEALRAPGAMLGAMDIEARAWHLPVVVMVDPPIPAGGRLGLWHLSAPAVAAMGRGTLRRLRRVVREVDRLGARWRGR